MTLNGFLNQSLKFKSYSVVPRQYLEYEGIGIGSPSKRQRQYQHYRVQRASDKVIDYKSRQFGDQETSIAEPEKRAIRRSKYSKVIDRLVEDLIQEAMSKGEFKNLAGSGKPLKLEQENFVGKLQICDITINVLVNIRSI